MSLMKNRERERTEQNRTQLCNVWIKKNGQGIYTMETPANDTSIEILANCNRCRDEET